MAAELGWWGTTMNRRTNRRMAVQAEQRGSAAMAALVVGLFVVGASGVAFFVLRSSSPGTSAGTADAASVAALERQLRETNRRIDVLERYLETMGTGLLPVAVREESTSTVAPEQIADAGTDEDRSERGDGGGRRGGGDRGFGGFDRARELREIEDPDERLAAALEMLEDDNPMVQIQALREILELDPQRAIDSVGELVAGIEPNSRESFMAGRMVSLLGDVEGASPVRELYALYDSEDDGVRRAAAQALEQQGDVTLVQRELAGILPRLSSADESARLDALSEAGRLGSPLAVPSITPMLSDASSEVRLRALEALGRTGDVSHVDLVEPYLDDPVAAVRDRASRTLESLRNPDSGGFDFGRGFGGRGGRGGR